MLSVWCITHLKPSVWINPSLWAEAQTGLQSWGWYLCVFHWICPPHSSPQMGFHFNWQLLRSIRQHDKLREGDCWGAPSMFSWRYRGGSIPFVCVTVWLLACTSFSSFFSWRAQIGQSQHQTPASCVCVECVCERALVCERGVHSLPIHWSQAFSVKSGLCLPDLPLLPSFFLAVIPWHMALTHPECCTGGKITHISDLLNSFFSECPRERML